MAAPPSDAYTTPFQLTKSMHRDVYSAIDPATNKELSATDKVIIVFGATSGLGFATAKSWNTAGAKGIVLVGRNSEGLQKAEKDLAAKSEVLSITADVGSVADTDAVFKKTLEKFGRVDVVVTAFGAMAVAPVGAQEPAAWWENFEVNTKGVYHVAHSYITVAGGNGTLINMVSLAASFVAPGMSGYSASKLAVIRLGEILDVEQPGLRVFSIHPGIVIAENGRGAVFEPFRPFTHDTAALTGGLTTYLATPKADFLKGGYLHANWDVVELEKHKDEIVEKKLAKLAFLNGQLGPEGHPWSS
ncbi:hypothetical protein PFICI_05370 [Pestalotiopsis fici W106-1]|uniref:NAD(P)-binding protein n=1 Tax=Pestalotiopsis fici (strain W106-1 / CGMCC3.15140) TaxID=1229662 RepID=W3XBU1_PESFW|nr:uncharacterized protein PFICI_05370 [Pestalotiopsis fici W106-1]ETS83494.1 hypothetical protein PFICI_05370 [Pestalotiopsis fici W106-1]